MYLAIDIGGTKTLIAAFSRSGRVVRRLKFKTAQNKDKFLLDLLRNLVVFEKYQIETVVVAIPGTVQKNCSVSLGNRDWGTFSLLKPLKELFSCPIYFENDANLATIYESHRLHGRTIFLTFSTGIGGGIADNGVLSQHIRTVNKVGYSSKTFRFILGTELTV
jgi:predicted NBD/HSP70 family sugar kinase